MMNAPDQHHMMGMMQHHGMGPMQQPMQQQQGHFPKGPPPNQCCGGCGAKITDRFLLHALDRYWHHGCLKCSACQATLADMASTFFQKGSMILCKNDYLRMFCAGGPCSGCGQTIPPSEFVMRAGGNVYHLKCFACVKCHNQLVQGDRFNLVNGSVLCEQDCIKMLKGTVPQVRKTKMSRVNSAIKVG